MDAPRRSPRPDFFLVGHPKCGTTALYKMLGQHPQVFMCVPKEPNLFAADYRREFDPVLPRDGDVTSLDDYLALFADSRPQQLAGEASTYSLVSEVAPGAIREHNPSARIVAVFREPAEFLWSYHLQLIKNQQESVRDLRAAMALEPERRKGRRMPRTTRRRGVLHYAEFLRYTDQLRRYHEHFPRDQVLALLYEDFRRDNAQTVRSIFRFLGVDDSAPITTPEKANPTVGVRSQALDEAVTRMRVGSGPASSTARSVIKGLLPAEPRRRLLRYVQTRVVRKAPPPPDPELMADLRTRFRPEVERLGDYLDRDLVSFWGYAD